MFASHRSKRLFAVGVLLGLGGILSSSAGCSPGSNNISCEIGSDCESGVCEDNVCVDPSATTGSGGNSASSSASSSNGGSGGGKASTTGSSNPTATGSGGAAVCSPNNDGTITREESPIVVGAKETFEVATNVTFDSAGTTSGGKHTWNLKTSFSGDHQSVIETISPVGQWWEADFVGANYAAKLSDSATLLGVFQANDTQILLVGVVSPTSGSGSTELKYSPPVPVLEFPLTVGKKWNVTSTVSGYADSVPGAYTETYAFEADEEGTLSTPFADFPVIRVSSSLTRVTGGIFTYIQSFAFVTECFGTVGSLTSQTDETQKEFTNVAELKRLAP